MRKLIPFLVLLLVFGGVVTTSAAQASCTIKGTHKTDFLSGTEHHDVICGRGGNDFLAGQGGNDFIRGGPNNDTVVGGQGRDRIIGRGGNDQLFAVDGVGGDRIRGGPGNDKCYGEKQDRFWGCEKVSHSNSPSYPRPIALALSNALDRSIAVAQRQLCRNRKLIICVLP